MDQEGKLIIVTGANAGIGKETALGLAKMGAHVVMICRNKDRGEKAQTEIKQISGNNQVDLLLADLSSQDSIRQAAEEINDRYDRLDVLVNNAGAFFWKRQESVDGLEMTFALDHLGYFLLTNLLIETIRKSAPARIVNVASAAHDGARINFDDLQSEKSYAGMRAYGQAKLANILFTYELARRLEGTGVTVNALHPGFVASNFAGNNGFLVKLGMKMVSSIFGISPEKGAQTVIYLASAPEVEGISGEYFIDCQPVSSSTASYNEDDARRLWEVSETLTGLDDKQ